MRHLVYLDAFVPGDGDSLASLAGLPEARAIAIGDEWLVPPVPRAYDDENEAAFMIPRRVSHPAACFSEPVQARPPPGGVLLRAHLHPGGRGRSRTRRRPQPSTLPPVALAPRTPGTIARSRRTTLWRATGPAELSEILIALERETWTRPLRNLTES